MNILNLLTKEKHVAGIEISDSVVRISFFRPKKKNKKEGPQEDGLILIEEPIAADIIADGIVMDVDLLGKTLKNIWTAAALGTEYAIVAIPDDKIYSKIFSFPKSVSDTRMIDAMRLAINFQLPMKTGDVYLDWERVEGSTTTNDILLSTIPRPIAEGYVQALEKAGIKTLALESHLAAVARSVQLTPGEVALFSKNSPDGTTIFALKDGVLRFSRTLPFLYVPENKIPDEIKKVQDALTTEGSNVLVKELTTAPIRDEYSTRTEITEPKSKWFVSLGAAIRGQIPAGEDNLISLLPIGTEEAYAYQRTTTFVILMRNLTIGVSVFFIVAYLATYLFMLNLLQNTTKQIITLSTSAAPSGFAEKEQQVKDLNALTATGAALLSQTPTWSAVINELIARTPDGITISMFSAPTFTGVISITGTAASRTLLNDYKKTLQESPLFSDVVLPLSNLDQKEKIPFSISFKLKDPNALYYANTDKLVIH